MINEIGETTEIFFGLLYGTLAVELLFAYVLPKVRKGGKTGRRERKSREFKSFVTLLLSLYAIFFMDTFFMYFSYYSGFGELPFPLTYLGVVLTLGGIGFRLWAILTMGKFFSPVVTVLEDHRVVDSGPYVHVRHPAYSGSIIMLIGIATTSRSIFSLVLSLIVSLLVYNHRAKLEERLLVQELGDEYISYMHRVTKRFFPRII